MGRPKEVTDEQIIRAARRCFFEEGANVPAGHIARALGVSHTTIFNRFRTKKALMLAALEPPQRVPWVEALEAGPDDRPMRDQLVDLAKVMSAHFQDMHAGLAILQAAGIKPLKGRTKLSAESPPVVAFRTLTEWLRRGQNQGRLAMCDVETLASTLLGALHGWAITARFAGQEGTAAAGQRHVERFIDLLWTGIGGGGPRRKAPK